MIMWSFLNSGWQNINLIDTDCYRFCFINQNVLQRPVGRLHQWTQIWLPIRTEKHTVIAGRRRYRQKPVDWRRQALSKGGGQEECGQGWIKMGWISLLEVRHEKAVWFLLVPHSRWFCPFLSCFFWNSWTPSLELHRLSKKQAVASLLSTGCISCGNVTLRSCRFDKSHLELGY